MKNFEEFLQNKHAENYHGTDDDMPDRYEHWLSQLDVSEVMEFAEEAMQLARIEGKQEIVDIIEPTIKELSGLSTLLKKLQ